MTEADMMDGFHIGEPCEGCGECVPVAETFGMVMYCIDCIYIQLGVRLSGVIA